MRRIVIALLMAGLLMAPSAMADDLWELFTGRDHIEGSGDLVTETRDLESFSRIKCSGSMDLYVHVGKNQEVKLTFDDNLLDLIETEVRGKTLKIWSEESYSSHRSCRIDISVKELDEVRLTGSADIEIYDLQGDSFECTVSGSGEVTINGRVEELDVRVSGSGDVDARELEASEVYVRVSGSGDVAVYASESFEGSVSGSGDISFYGDPEHVSRHVSGSGDIRKKR